MTGLVFDLDERAYHSHQALSSTEARILLRPGGPARYRWAKDHPPLVGPSKKFDVGTLVHTKVLGSGPGVAVIPDEVLGSNGSASTAAAKAFIAEARAEGLVPMKAAEFEPVDRMSEAVLAHPTARALAQQPGRSEVSVFATDPDTGVETRARFDFLPELELPRPVAWDLKTTAGDATPDEFGFAAAKYRYDAQQEWYRHTLNHSGVDGNMPQFVFVAVEKEAPHLVAVIQLPEVLVQRGRLNAAKARALYAECSASNRWPGHPDGVQFADVPRFVEYEDNE